MGEAMNGAMNEAMNEAMDERKGGNQAHTRQITIQIIYFAPRDLAMNKATTDAMHEQEKVEGSTHRTDHDVNHPDPMYLSVRR